MIAMITYGNKCCLGLNIAPALIEDHDVFQQCIAEGFDEVLALAPPPQRPSTQRAAKRQPAKRQPAKQRPSRKAPTKEHPIKDHRA